MIYKINQLTIPLDSRLQNHFKTEQLAYQYISSRLALKQCLKEMVKTSMSDQLFLPEDFKLLQLENYTGLVNFPQLTVSLSHTKTTGAAMVAARSECKSVGIDIEKTDRKLADKIAKKFINQQDQSDRSILEIWAMKEAAFKAITGIKEELKIEQSLVLQNIILSNQSFGISCEQRTISLLGSIECFTITINEENLIVALAKIPSEFTL